jgi:hypothetical protein
VAQKSSAEKRQELRVLDEAIAERKKYYREQEHLITETIERGNSKIMELVHDTTVAKKELRDLKTDIRTSAQDKKLLNEDLDNIRNELIAADKQLNTGLANAFA